MSLLKSATPEKYVFKLFSNYSGVKGLIADTEPQEWESGAIAFKRDLENGGVFKSFSVSSLTFTGNAAEHLRMIFRKDGFLGQVTLKIFELDNSTLDYIEFPSTYEGRFDLFKPEVKIGNQSIGANIDFSKSGMLTKIENRKSQKVYLERPISPGVYESVGGFKITDDRIVRFDLPITIPAIDSNLRANFNTTKYDHEVVTRTTNLTYSTPMLTRQISGYPSSETTFFIPFGKLQTMEQTGNIFENSTKDQTVRLYGSLTVQVDTSTTKNVYDLLILIWKDGVQVGENIIRLGFGQIKGLFNTSYEQVLEFDETISLLEGQSIKLIYECEETTILQDGDAVFKTVAADVNLFTPVADLPESVVFGKKIYEAVRRCLQLITDKQTPLDSMFLLLYPLIVTNGLCLRGLPMDHKDNAFSISWVDLWESIRNVLNLGWDIRMVDGEERVYIGEQSDFFINEIGLDFSNRVTKYDIETEVMPELAYSRIKYGYEKFTYELLNGMGEYNNQAERSTVLNTDNELNLVSKIRADPNGIIQMLKKRVGVTGSEDTEGDSDFFFLKVIQGYLEFTAETNEFITVENDSSPFGSQSLNLDLTPMRIFNRHGARIRAGLEPQMSSQLRFQTSSKGSNLVTSEIIDGFRQYLYETRNEASPLKTSDLNTPIWQPLKDTAEIYLTMADIQYINTGQNMYKLYKFTDEKVGYILGFDKPNGTSKGKFSIIRKYNG